MNFYFYLGLAVSFVISCQTEREVDTIEKCEEIRVDPTSAITIDRSELFTLEDIIKLENAYRVGEVNDLLIKNNFIIYNSDQVRLFSSEGEFLRNISSEGSGPGEYQSKQLDFDGDDLLLMDSKQQKMLTYRLPDGELLSERSLGGLEVFGRSFFHYEDINMIYVGNQLNKYDNNKLLLFDEQMQHIDSYFSINKDEIKYMNFIDKTNFTTYKDSVRFLYAYSDGIYNIDVEDSKPSVTKRYCVDFGDFNIPDDFFQYKYKNVRDFALKLEESNYASQIMGFFETDDNIIFMFKYGGDRLMANYSKEDKQTTVINNIYDDLIFNGLTVSPGEEFFSSYFFQNNKIYFTVHAFQFIENINNAMNINPDVELKPEIKDIYKNLNKDDNPVIFELKINQI